MGKGTSAVDLGGVDGEVAAARQRALETKAHAVHAELTALVQRENHDSYRKCELLAQVRDDELHVAYAEGFGPYCVRYRFATSERLACAMATLWTKLEDLPELRAVFQAGQVGWTLVRDAADMATAKLATDAELAKLVASGTYRDLQALKRQALVERGETPTTKRTLEWKEETDARLARVVAILSADAEPVLGRSLTLGEGIEHMLALVEQVLHTPEEAEPAADESAAPPSRARVARLPEPLARTHAFVDPKTHEALLHGPDGLVKLDKATFELLTCCLTEHQDEEGKVSRTIPRALQRQLWERDRGCCQVPGCGRTRHLHIHHEGDGEGGYLQIGHDPDRMLHLCTTHHVLRHQGWLRITGRHSTGFRFLRADGTELTARVVLPAVVGSAVQVRVAEAVAVAPAAEQTSARAHVGGPAPVAPAIAASPTAAPVAHVGARSASNRQAIADAESALVGLECTRREARALVARAMTTLGSDFTAETLLLAALRAMPG